MVGHWNDWLNQASLGKDSKIDTTNEFIRANIVATEMRERGKEPQDVWSLCFQFYPLQLLMHVT